MDTYLEFASNHQILVTALTFSLFLLVFTELRLKTAGLINIEPQKAVQIMNADAQVIDVRGIEAFSRGHIVNARNIPFDELQAGAKKLGNAKSTPIIAVCDAGITSTKAVDALRKLGFENVYGIKGGMTAWTTAGLPVVTAKKSRKKT